MRFRLKCAIEKTAQKEILNLIENLKADIVVVPHHGSITTLDMGFLPALDPDILIYSCDKTQYERQQKIPLNYKTTQLYTATDGAITIRIDKNGWVEVEPYLSKKIAYTNSEGY